MILLQLLHCTMCCTFFAQSKATAHVRVHPHPEVCYRYIFSFRNALIEKLFFLCKYHLFRENGHKSCISTFLLFVFNFVSVFVFWLCMIAYGIVECWGGKMPGDQLLSCPHHHAVSELQNVQKIIQIKLQKINT